MGTPKKPVKNKAASKSTGAQRSEDSTDDLPAKKRIVDDEYDEDFDMPLDDISRYESFDNYDDDDDF